MNNNAALLKERIALLESRQSQEISILKEQALVVYESVKPVNLLKNVLKDFTTQPELKENTLGGIAVIASGYLSKKLLIGTSNSPLKKIAGILFHGIRIFSIKMSQTSGTAFAKDHSSP
mgnify:CR=1 FL=1